MLYGLLSASEKTRPVRVPDAALYALLGFLTVFVGIIILILVVWLVGKIMVKMKGQPSAKAAPIKEKPVAPVAQTQPTAFEDVDEETVAVIMATLTAYYQTNYPKYEFTVKRIKRF